MKPIEGGTYKVNDQMIEDLKNEVNGEHASNLGAVLAKEIGDEINVESFVVDPVSVDEFQPVSRFTGISDIEKVTQNKNEISLVPLTRYKTKEKIGYKIVNELVDLLEKMCDLNKK